MAAHAADGPRITVFTATYNRAPTLPALAASLSAQIFQDFEWIVVDDGSIDDTSEVLAKIVASGNIRLRVISVSNGGKHRAINLGVAEARAPWFFIVDSDDRLPPSALAVIAQSIPLAEAEERCGGIMGLKADFSQAVVGERLPENLAFADSLELTYKYDIRGDKAEVFKTSILRDFPFPAFPGEKHLTECVVWYRIARAGWKLLLTNEVLYEADYQGDGLSSRSLELRIRDIEGTLLFYREELEGGLPLLGMLRESSNYVRFCLHARRLRQLLSAPGRLALPFVLAALPAGLIMKARDARTLRRLL